MAAVVSAARLRELRAVEYGVYKGFCTLVEDVLDGAVAAKQGSLTPEQETAFRENQTEMRIAMGRVDLLTALLKEAEAK